MSRNATHFFEGQIPADADNVAQLVDALRDEITGFLLPNGLPAWELFDEVDATPQSTHRVYRSKGDTSLANSDAGDKNLLFAIEQLDATTIQFRAHQDWSTSSHTGSRTVEDATSITRWPTITASVALNYWGVINEYFLWLFMQRGVQNYTAFVLNPDPMDLPPSDRGICRVATNVLAGATVIPVDRDVSSDLGSGRLSAGQLIALVPVTPDGAALVSATIEEHSIDSVSPSQIVLTGAGLAADLKAGAIIGSDPNALFLRCANSNGTVGYSAMYATHHVDGTFSSALGQISNLDSFIRAVRSDFTGGDGGGGALDYDVQAPQSLVYGSQMKLLEPAPYSAYRGATAHLLEFHNADVIWVDNDRSQVNDDATQFYRMMNSLRISQVNASNRNGVGVGAPDAGGTDYAAWPWVLNVAISAFVPDPLIFSVSPSVVPKDGGHTVTLSLLSGSLPDGRFRVYVGPLGSVVDPLCFSGELGAGSETSFVNGVGTFVVPPLPVGGPYSFFLLRTTGDDAVLTSVTSDPLLTVIPHEIHSRVLQLRRLLPKRLRTGYRTRELVGFPQ